MELLGEKVRGWAERLLPGESDCQGIARGRPGCLQQPHQASAREIGDVTTRPLSLAVTGLHSWPRN
jgi:hypothetical protein